MLPESATLERRLREDAFRGRRRRVLRAEAAVAACFVLGLGVVFAAKQSAPEAFDAAVAGFLLATFAAFLLAWYTLRRHWRCPACDVRWRSQDTLASLTWNHCDHCGAPLLAYPVQQDEERVAALAFAVEALPHAELVARFERRRRQARAWTAVAVLVGVAAVALVEGLGGGELAGQVGASVGAGGVAAAMLWGARCPRCQRGLVGQGRHCTRCGLRLEDAGEGAGSAPDPRLEG